MTTPETIHAIDALFSLPLLILGLSHVLQPELWRNFFLRLGERGPEAVIWRSFLFELWPAVLIVVLHQDWSWSGLPLTLYGHLLLAKVSLSLLLPQVGMRSLQVVEARAASVFLLPGFALIALGAFSAWRAVALA